MQQRGGAVLYAIDDLQRIRPEDTVAALRVAGERRDLLIITRKAHGAPAKLSPQRAPNRG